MDAAKIICSVGGFSIKLFIYSGSQMNILNGNDWKILKQNFAYGEPLQVKTRFQTTIYISDCQEII